MRRIKGICHKCKGHVPMEDDKGALLAILHDSPIEAYATLAQHILPSATCEGSPSVAQYLEGQPLDTRGYDLDPEHIPAVRAAYTQLRVLAGLHKGTPPLNRIPLIIKGETDDGENFAIAFSCPKRVRISDLYADCIGLLWDARWVPGSVSWRAYQVRPRPLADIPLPVGENY